MMFTLRKTWPLAIVLAASITAEAASLRVSPARIMLRDVEPGRTYDLFKETGVRLTIFNDDDVERTWALSTYRPSERGRWEAGYGEIPDASWCWFGRDEITIAPRKEGHGHLFLRVPAEEQFYNQHWIVTLAVEGKGGSQGGPGLGLAVEIRMQIETKSKTGLAGAPHGVLAMEPSLVTFDGIDSGSTTQASVLVYNNDESAHTYKVGSLFADKKHQPKTYLQHSFELIPDHAWLQYPQEIRIGAGETARLNITLATPEGESLPNTKWEDCILLQPDEGRPEFIRVQIDTGERVEHTPAEESQL